MPIESKGMNLNINHLRYHFFMSMIIAVSLIRVLSPFDIPVLIHLAIILLIILLCDKNELIACQCSLLPMLGIMQNRIALLLITIGILIRLKKIKLSAMIPLLLMVVWELLHIGQTHMGIYGFLREFAALIAITVLMMDDERKSYDYGFIIRSFALMTLVCSILNIMACSLQYGYSVLSLGRMGNINVEYEDFRGLINPNTNSFICLIAICALLLFKNTFEEHKIDKYFIVGLFIVILLTQSKSAILCVGIAYMFFSVFSNNYRAINLHMINRLIGASFVLLLCAVFFSDLIGSIIGRFLNGDFTTGRTMINVFYFRHIVSSPKYLLFGTGLYDYAKQMMELYPYSDSIWTQYPELATIGEGGAVVYKPCHLGLLELIVVWGVPGLFYVYLLFKEMLKERIKKDNKVIIIPLLIIFIYCLQSCFIGGYSILHALLIVFLGLKCRRTYS